jgi:hypothetical protein
MRGYAIDIDREAAVLRVVLPREHGRGSKQQPALTLRAPVLRRRASSLSGGTVATTTLAKDGHLEIARDAIVEHWRNRDHGVEQSWQLLHAPQGEGDLHVRIRTEGLPFVSADNAGLHFADASTGVGFVYGHATWIDALGVRTVVPVEYVAGAVSLRVPARTLRASRYPAVLDPLVSPEIALGVPLSAGPVLDEQVDPHVAYGGGNYLVTWQHSGVNGWSPYAARVTPQGVLLDPSGIQITSGGGNYGTPTAAFNGTHFLVVFGQNPAAGIVDLNAARVSTAGVVLDTPPLVIDTLGVSVLPSIAVVGSSFLVVWEDRGATSDIRGASVTSTGSVSASFTIAGGTHYEARPRVTSNGTGYLVVWDDNRSGNLDIYGARVSDGSVVGGDSLLISGGANAQTTPDIVWNGTHYLAVWADGRLSASGSDIYGARVTDTATVVDTAGILISTAASRQITPRVAAGGSDVLVVWRESRNDATVYGAANDIYGARVSDTGMLLDASGILISAKANAQGEPAIAWNGTHYLVVWSDDRNNRFTDIYGTRVDLAGTVLDPNGIAISTAPYFQSWPAVAANGSTFLVTWLDNRDYPEANDIYAARVANDGAVLDPSGIAIATDPAAHWLPAVTSNGTDYLVAWSQEEISMGDHDVYALRLDADGARIDTNAFSISVLSGSSQANPSLADCATTVAAIDRAAQAHRATMS